MDKKNTIFLTVIAVATLLVAVVGATFAYFTAQSNGKADTPVNVKTETTNSTTIKSGNKISILADQFNFADQDAEGAETYVGSQKGSSNATVSFAASSGATSAQKYCYTVDLTISKNEFKYPESHTDNPQLVFSISKSRNNKKEGSISEDSDTTAVYVEYGAESKNPIAEAGEYKKDVLTNTKVCDNFFDVSSPETGQANHYASNCQTAASISGFDITTKGNDSSDENKTKIRIPKLADDEVAGQYADNEYVHVITANKNETFIDFWKASVTFVNYDYDQEINTEKTFTGVLNFIPVDCTTGKAAGEE